MIVLGRVTKIHRSAGEQFNIVFGQLFKADIAKDRPKCSSLHFSGFACNEVGFVGIPRRCGSVGIDYPMSMDLLWADSAFWKYQDGRCLVSQFPWF